MGFCIKCGSKIAEGAEFCQSCGAPVTKEGEASTTTRGQEYSGKIVKCPNCGEVLKSSDSECPSCGMEIRGTKVSTAVSELEAKLESIEANRASTSSGSFKKILTQQTSKLDKQKIALIQNFVIPNTKEDIFEFMVLATSNVNAKVYNASSGAGATPTKRELNYAWESKTKQAFAKAQKMFGTSPDFAMIQNLYDSCYADIKKEKRKSTLSFVLIFGVLILTFAVPIIIININNSKKEADELDRLDALVVEVQDALDKNEYTLALKTADSLDYMKGDVAMEKKWDVQREYWTSKVIETAAKNGVALDYTPTEDIDNTSEGKNAVTGGAIGSADTKREKDTE